MIPGERPQRGGFVALSLFVARGWFVGFLYVLRWLCFAMGRMSDTSAASPVGAQRAQQPMGKEDSS